MEEANVSKAQLGLTAAASHLPDELWAFICDQLDYNGLKRFGGVCKAFQRLIQDPRYDRKLSRERPGRCLARGTKVAIHPMLDLIDCLGQDPTKAERFVLGPKPEAPDWQDKPDAFDDPEYLNGFDYKAVDEFATAPACKKVKIEMVELDCGTVSSSSGVTVRQIVEASLKYWSSPVTGRQKKRFLEDNQGYYSASDHITHVDLLYDHRFFEGWSRATVNSDGTVVLSVNGFGS